MPKGIYIRTTAVWNKGRVSPRKGLSLEQLYGKEKATAIKEKMKNSHLHHDVSTKTKEKLSALAQKRIKRQGRMNSTQTIEKCRLAAIEQFKDPVQHELRRKMRILLMHSGQCAGTKIELKVDKFLTENNISHVYQFNIDNKYISDFAIPSARLIIECDGCYWHRCLDCYPAMQDKQKDIKDHAREEYFKKKGWRIVRIWEHDINKDFEKVKHTILQEL